MNGSVSPIGAADAPLDPGAGLSADGAPALVPVTAAESPVPAIRGSGTLLRVTTVVASHPVIDAYSGFVPPILGVLQVRCELTPWQAASLLSIGPLTSGLCQPFFAWLSDRVDSRVLGPAGLAVAAVMLSCVGLADRFATLVPIFALGMLGVGAFHPVAAASIGQLSGSRRSAGVTLFFVAGMVGATAGPIISSRITAIEPNGFALLRWVMIPGLVTAVLLHLAIRDVSHHHHAHGELRLDAAEMRVRWRTVLVLFAGNALRFSVNIGLFYVYVRWAEAVAARGQPGLAAEAIAAAGALYCGELNALTMLGMGVGGLLTGLFVRPGREKAAFVLLPLVLAPLIALFPSSGRLASYGLAVGAGVGYAAVIPVSISLAQRLLPHRTGLASGLMMGGAWAVAALAPPAAEWSVATWGIGRTFGLLAALLALSGVLGLLLSGRVVRSATAGPPSPRSP